MRLSIGVTPCRRTDGIGLRQWGQSGAAAAEATPFSASEGLDMSLLYAVRRPASTMLARIRPIAPLAPKPLCSTPYLGGIRGRGTGMRIAVIGTGIAGNAAAWTLSKRYPVTVYEREIRPGGHSHTVTIDYDETPIAVDIGFIVYNELNYPDLTALFANLGVETRESHMSFAVTADGGRFEWKGGGNNWWQMTGGLFAQPRNLLSPSYLRMLRDIPTFSRQSVDGLCRRPADGTDAR